MLNRFKKDAPKTMTDAMKRGLFNATKMILGLVVGLILVHWFTAGQDNIINGATGDIPGQETLVERAPAKDSPEYLLKKHTNKCWTMAGTPKAQLPSAAIVQFQDGHAEYVRNDTARGFKLVDEAFSEALMMAGLDGAESNRIDVVALCV